MIDVSISVLIEAEPGRFTYRGWCMVDMFLTLTVSFVDLLRLTFKIWTLIVPFVMVQKLAN